MASPFVISMKFVSDASGATAATGNLRKEITDLGAVLDTSRSKAVALQNALDARGTSSAVAEAYQATLVQIQAEQKLEAQRLSAQISDAGRAQSISRLAALSRDGAVATQNLARAEAEAATSETRMSKAASEAAVSVSRLADQQERVSALRAAGINSNLGVRDDFGAGARGADIEAYGRELDTLRARYNPLFAAEQRREASLGAITRAHRLGAISAEEMSAAVRAENAAYNQSVAAIGGNTEALQRNQAMRAGRGSGGSNFATANIAAQFQDIAVTSAMGMSPLQIALQQGTQISAAFGNVGAAGAVRTLGAAFLSIISPVSLVTIGLVAGTAAAIQYFSGLGGGAEDADKRLDRHLERIQKMARGYDEATTAAEEYIEESRKRPEGSVASDAERDRSEALQQVSRALDVIAAKNAEIATDFMSWQANRMIHADLIDTMTALGDVGITATSTTNEINALDTKLTQLANNPDAPAQARQYASDLLELIEQLRTAKGEVGSLGATLQNLPSNIVVRVRLQAAGFQKAMGDLSDIVPDARPRTAVMRDENETAFQRAALSAPTTSALNAATEKYQENLKGIAVLEKEAADREAAKIARSANQVSAYDREIASLRERAEAQTLETSVMGQSAFAIEKARVTLQLETAARKDAIGLTPSRIAQIEAEAAAYATAAAAQDELLKTQQAVTEQYEFSKGTWRGLFADMKSGLREGLNGWEAMGAAGANAFDKIADRALAAAADIGFDLLFGALTGGAKGGGAGGGGLLSGIASIFGFADGGWTGGSEGQPRGIVHGEEFVVRAGPAAQHRSLLETLNSGGSPSMGGGGSITLAPTYNFNGSGFTEAQARRMQEDNNRDLMAMIPGAMTDASRRAVRGAND